MSEDKTIEQLETEYKQLIQEKLDAAKKEAEELEQKQKAEELAAQKKKEREELKDEIKKEMGFTTTSRLDTPPDKEPTNMTADTKNFEQFRADFARHKGLNITGKTYEEQLQDIQDQKGAKLE